MGISSRELHQQGGDAVPAQQGGHGHAKPATRFGQFVGSDGNGGLGFGEHSAAALVIGLACLAQALAPCGAVEEADAQALFEETNVLADHWPRYFERIGGSGERTHVNRLDEDGHAGQAVHDCKLLVSTVWPFDRFIRCPAVGIAPFNSIVLECVPWRASFASTDMVAPRCCASRPLTSRRQEGARCRSGSRPSGSIARKRSCERGPISTPRPFRPALGSRPPASSRRSAKASAASRRPRWPASCRACRWWP